MIVGVCEKCRYVDLIENPDAICPRCGANIVSLGVGSAQWNKMNHPEKTALINSRFPEPDPSAAPLQGAGENHDIREPNPESGSGGSLPDTAASQEAGAGAVPQEDENSGGFFNGKLDDYIYICYKCDKTTSHDYTSDKYYCPECGSDMIWTGFTTYEWSKLSIRAKRNAADNSKIRYIETKIKKTDFKS